MPRRLVTSAAVFFVLVLSPKSGIAIDAQQWPTATWEQFAPEYAGMDEAKLAEARNYALTGGGSGFVVRSGRLVMSWGM